MTVFINKGDAPLTVRQAEKRGQKLLNLEMKPYEREAAASNPTPEYQAWVSGWLADNVVNAAHNLFNHQLHGLRKATARLDRYQLSVGRVEVTEQQPTEAFDEFGDPIMETVVVQTAIDPLPATVDGWDNTDPENPVAVQVPNPLIVADEAERIAAQAVVDVIPQEVKDF
jgi:hypothetical protein